MNSIQTALSSARFNRIMLAIGVLLLASGAMTLVFKLAGIRAEAAHEAGSAQEQPGHHGEDVRAARPAGPDEDPHLPRHGRAAAEHRALVDRRRPLREGRLHV